MTFLLLQSEPVVGMIHLSLTAFGNNILHSVWHAVEQCKAIGPVAPSAMTKLRGLLQDVYMQTNTLAALTNLAPHMSGLTSHAAQRLVSLFDMVARKHSKLSQFDSGSAAPAPVDGVNGAACGAAGCCMYAQPAADRCTVQLLDVV